MCAVSMNGSNPGMSTLWSGAVCFGWAESGRVMCCSVMCSHVRIR